MPQHQPVEAVLFDLDGTLIDTAREFSAVLNRMRQQRELPPLAFDEVRATVSDGARALVQLAFGVAEGEPGFDALRQELLDLYEEHLSRESALFPGMDQVLAWLDREELPWGIVTNKPERYADPLVRALGLDGRCRVLICPDHVRQRKPDPEGLLMACGRIGGEPARTVYVGDHLRDIEAGRRAGMYTVACGYGYVHADTDCNDWQADLVIASAGELIDWLRPRVAAARSAPETSHDG